MRGHRVVEEKGGKHWGGRDGSLKNQRNRRREFRTSVTTFDGETNWRELSVKGTWAAITWEEIKQMTVRRGGKGPTL